MTTTIRAREREGEEKGHHRWGRDNICPSDRSPIFYRPPSYRDRMDAKRPGSISSSRSQPLSLSLSREAAISLDCRLISVRASLAIEARSRSKSFRQTGLSRDQMSLSPIGRGPGEWRAGGVGVGASSSNARARAPNHSRTHSVTRAQSVTRVRHQR